MSWQEDERLAQMAALWRDHVFTQLTDGAQALWHRGNCWLDDNAAAYIPDSALKLIGARKRYVLELERTKYWARVPAGGWAVGS
jgi:hypothetical protein